ncbi:MAG: hypothetical protein HWD61_04940 [Parachlamydiaceae bacterium]|nr:MAG: hypothetical protein HWD61_04940 [Parachlamydiaceae bacterium]
MEEKVKEVQKQSKNELERTKAIRELFAPLSEEFLNQAGPDVFEVLPIPGVLKEMLIGELKQKFFPIF